MSSYFAENLHGQEMFKILDEARKIEETGKHVLHFEIGDPDFNTEYSIKEALIQAIQRNETHYTSSKGHPDLINNIIKTEKLFYKNIKKNNVQVLIANSAIFFSLMCLSEKKDNVLLPNPYFPTYISAAKSIGSSINFYNLDQRKNFKPNADEILSILKKKKIKLVIFNNPGNPTGVKYDYNEIISVINYCQENEIFCLFDEVYHNTVFDGKKETILEKLDNLSSVAILRSFSKQYFMTGFRVGYLIGDPKFIEKIKLANETINSCLPPFVQIAAAHALEQNYELKYSKAWEIIRGRRDIIYEGLTDYCNLDCVKPNSSFYIFPKLPNKYKGNSNKFAFDLLHSNNIAICPGNSFGDKFKKNFRMCYASVSNEDLYKTIDILKKSI